MKETEYRCPSCYLWAPWTDGIMGSDDESDEFDEYESDEFWCQTCGSQTPLDDMESRTTR